MCKQSAHSYCPTCDTYRPADHFKTADGDPRHRCHGCGGLLVDAVGPGLYSGDVEILGRLAGFVARALIARGVLSALEERQEAEFSKGSHDAFRNARILLKEAAKL